MEENMEEIQAKQTLLQTEIIDKNYDKTAFINFCLSKKENGDDLNNWTLDELKQIVSEFVSTQNEGQSIQVDSQPPEQPQYNAPSGDGQQEIKKEDIEKMEKFNAEESKNFKEKVIQCKKLEKTELSDKKLNISVRNPKEKDGGVLHIKHSFFQRHLRLFLLGFSPKYLISYHLIQSFPIFCIELLSL